MAIKKRGIYWINKGWQPVYIGFCPDEKSWKKYTKKINKKKRPDYPKSDGRITYFQSEDEGSVALITINPPEDTTLGEIYGLIIHESVHAFQFVCKSINEEKPSAEFEAYSIQAISQQLMSAYREARGIE